MENFEQELGAFLSGCGISFRTGRISGLSVLFCDKCGLALIAVPVLYFAEGGTTEALGRIVMESGMRDAVCVYQDRWIFSGPLVRSMLRVRLGLGASVFARNCGVRSISAETAASFLEANHIYGTARSAVRLGLFRVRSTGGREIGMDATPVLVAVASFSAGRRMENGLMSYEWVRYASLRGVRVVGGMGRLLQAFADAMRREGAGEDFEVMTYADTEWYGGGSYLNLGFRDEGFRPPVRFLCDPVTGLRVHEGKIGTDRRFRGMDVEGMVPVLNLGSRKFVLSVSGRR